MRLADLAAKLLSLSQTLHAWLELLTGLETSRRQRIAVYADEIAATLKRAADALTNLESNRTGRQAARARARDLARELGRINGYVEDIVALLETRLDGRKLAGVKRRLETMSGFKPAPVVAEQVVEQRIEKLLEAEGYFRALADGLRI